MTHELWLNPVAGVAGDMLLAALLDAGAAESNVLAQLDSLGLAGWKLSTGRAVRAGLSATTVEVSTDDHHPHRAWSTIDAMLAEADLEPRVSAGARSTFRRLGLAEAHVHDVDLDEVHFHEVGAVDAIIDIVGTWAALSNLAVDAVRSGPVGLGTGTAATAHGRIPVPAPATLELLKGVPVTGLDVPFETATPTGAALLATMVDEWRSMPAGRIASIGRGAGAMDPATHANVVTAVVLDVDDAPLARTAQAILVETNVDDVTPEVLGHVLDRALALGADDAWIVPITMKKSRPGHQVRVLCAPELADAIAHLLATETGTLGLRRSAVDKLVLDRHVDTVEVAGHLIRIKVGPHGAKPEHDDVARAAESLGRPLRDVSAEALNAWTGRRS